MVGDTQHEQRPPSPGNENRAFTRNAIFLAGTCAIPGQPDHEVEILDFCPGGVFLSFPSGKPAQPEFVLPRGEIIDIRCAVPTASGMMQSLHFQGRVARADLTGAGIAFINPSFEALHLLHEYAKHTPPKRGRMEAHKPEAHAGVDATTQSLIDLCAKLIEQGCEPMSKDFLKQATEHFFNLAGDTRDIADKTAYYAAFTTFNKNGAAFTHEFAERIHKRLRQTPLVDEKGKKSSLDSGEHGELTLSLVEEDAFEDWLSFTDMARAAELEHKEQLHALERRLAALLKRPIDKGNNPFGPGTISQLFQEALGTLALDRKSTAESCKIFKNILCGQSGGLYAELNRHLVDGGVMPVLRPEKAPKPVQSTLAVAAEPHPQPEPVPEASVLRQEEVAQQHAQTAPPTGKPVQVQAQPIPPTPSAAPANLPPTAALASPGETVPSAAPTPQTPQDWYHLIQGLTSLQQQLSQAPARAGGTVPPTSPATSTKADATPSVHAQVQTGAPPEIRHFTTDEVLSALSRIQLETSGGQTVENFHQDLMGKFQSALADSGSSDEARVVPNRENHILEFGGNLFGSVLNDQLVADTVKPWLNQLSIPLIKMALRDDSLFYDKSHLARQLINRIAELELFSEISKVENAVRKKIDGLLAEITDAEEVTPELLQKMLKEVGLLVHVQNKAYEGNLHDLRANCEAEEERAKNKKPSAQGSALNKLLAGLGPLLGEEPPAEDESLREYIQRVRRIKIGNWLMLKRNGKEKRIRLAWMDKNREKHVFVNVQGLREETLSQIELAQFLRDGDAVVLEEGEEQLVDRAQSAMLQKMHLQLLHETTHDQLTGLINRRAFEKRLAEILAKARDSGTQSMLCYLDLSQFSVINNTFGYEGGDRALVEVSRLLEKELDEKGVLARIGGDEFAMLFENRSLDQALQITSRVNGAFRDYRYTAADKSLSLSFSAGLVTITPESESIETLLRAAETSCSIARGKGTNYVQVYEDSLARHLDSVKWVSRIDEALDNNRLELRCQPIVCISGGSVAIHHSEVLLRVPDEQGKQTSPVDFIMAAEHFRRMANVDRWVIEHAFLWLVDRRDKLGELGGLAINLSGASLNEEGLAGFVMDLAEKLNVPMEKVCFEVTETVGISHLSGASAFIEDLKQRTGCTFSLDDFGSGQSSYAYLKNLPVDYLKIDGVFVEKMDQNPYDFAVVKSITEIGHFMGKKIIAERVENEAVLKMLRQIGVDYAQGYYLGKPRNMKTLGS